jgi:hypothetical protein
MFWFDCGYVRDDPEDPEDFYDVLFFGIEIEKYTSALVSTAFCVNFGFVWVWVGASSFLEWRSSWYFFFLDQNVEKVPTAAPF